MSTTETTENKWHLDRRVPVVLIFTMLVQFVGFGFWLGSLNSQVDNLALQVAKQESNHTRIVRLETLVDTVRETLEKIDKKLDRITK